MLQTTKTVILAASITLNIIGAIAIKAIHSGEYEVTRVIQAQPVILSSNNKNDDYISQIEGQPTKGKTMAAR